MRFLPGLLLLLALSPFVRADDAPATEPVLPADAAQPQADTRDLTTYEDYAPSPDSYLIGVDISAVRQSNGKLYYNSIRPLYSNPDPANPSPLTGQPFVGDGHPGRHTVIQAKPGYAVAAIIYHQDKTIIDGYRIVFDRVAGDHLDTSDSYPFRWIGEKGKIVSDSHGSLIRGIRATGKSNLHTLTLLTEVPDHIVTQPNSRPFAYHEPDPSKAPFSTASLQLSSEIRVRLAGSLAAYAADHAPNPATPKFLGVALAVDPDNRAAILANASLKRGSFKPATQPATAPADPPAKDILEAAQQAKSANTPADLALAACLYDLVLTLQPAQEDALYQSELLRRAGHAPDWAWAVGAPASSPAPSTAIKSFARTQTTINGLAVHTDSAGQHFGQVLEIILTVSPVGGRGPQVQISGKLGKEMQIALDEAVRTVKVRYPNWEHRKLTISFDDKYSPKDGGSAGTAFALLMLSSIEGWEIDRHFAITGDITVDGKVRGIGGVDAKVHGAVADGCSLVAVPAENAERIADYLVLNSPRALADIQIFSASTLDEASDLAHAGKPEKITQAIDLFAQFQAAYKAAPSTYLTSNEAKQKLGDVLELAPGHLSAKYLLLCAEGKQPKKLSIGMSLYRMALASNRLLENIKDAKRLANQQLPDAVFTDAVRQLRTLRIIAADETFNTLTTLIEYIEALQRYNRHSLSLPDVVRRFEAWKLALSKLEADPDTMSKILREGV